MTNHPICFRIKREHEARNETLSPGLVRGIHVCRSFLGICVTSNERGAIDLEKITLDLTHAECERPEYTSNIRQTNPVKSTKIG